MKLPKIIFVHIPKAAGSSQLRIMEEIYGPDMVFWWPRIYGENVNTLQGPDTQRWTVSGGHIPLRNYDMPNNKHSLIIGLLREPVDRVFSLFDFCAHPANAQDPESRLARQKMHDELMDDGFDPSSVKISIERSEIFRRHCSNAHCDYLSLYEPTFAGVELTLKGHNFVLGVTDGIADFHHMLNKTLGWNASNIVVNKSATPLNPQFLREKGLIELIRSINSEDLALYQYVAGKPGHIWCDFPSIQIARYFLFRPMQTEPCDIKNLQDVFLKAPDEINLNAGTPTEIPVELLNKSEYKVCALRERGLFVSYSLLDIHGKKIECNGHRTLVPYDLLPHSTMTINAILKVPRPFMDEAIALEISLLYEGKIWFTQLNGSHAATVKLNYL